MKKWMKSWKPCVSALMGILVAGTVFFTGCASSNATQASSTGSGSGIPSAASTENVSDARNTPVVRAAKAVGPAVVGITNKAVARDWFDNQVQVEKGVGSGVIFRKDGYIVTNNHVVSGAKELIVSFADGKSLKGTLVGADELTDIAVVKVDGKVGEPAIAIGNPMGLEFQGSVTSGVISALNRTLNIGERRLKLLQTDAAISPGNSGGALVNADGKVIGINSAKVAANGVEGMGFAIPINTVREVVDEIMKNGYVARPYLGVGVFDKETAARQGYELNVDAGVYVERVTINGPAGRAGIQRGDIILEVGGTAVNTVADLRAAVTSHKVGETVKVKYERDNQQNTVDVSLDEMPKGN